MGDGVVGRAAVGDRAHFEPLPDLTLNRFSRPVRRVAVVNVGPHNELGGFTRLSGWPEQRKRRAKDDRFLLTWPCRKDGERCATLAFDDPDEPVRCLT